MEDVRNNFKRIKTPLIICQGKIDKVIDPMGAYDLYEHSNTPVNEKKLLWFETGWHDLLHDPVWEECVD